MPAPAYPGAVPPERNRWQEAFGARVRLHEWGDPERTPVVLVHGMFDHGRTFDVLAPLLAERFHVVSIDARGHGDSDWVHSYAWRLDVMTIVEVLRSVRGPAHLIGHSRGGGQVTDAAVCAPDDVRQVVDIDGFGPPPDGFQLAGQPVRTPRPAPEVLADFMQWRRKAGEHAGWRAYPSIEDLAQRRKKQNPRLSLDWLRYFSAYAARREERGWVWKVDPTAIRGCGPWRPDWIGPSWKPLRAPMLALTGTERDTWGPLPEEIIEERLEHIDHVERARIKGTGHFVHLEKPGETAALLLEWLEA